MRMNFVTKIREMAGKTKYAMAKDLNLASAQVIHMEAPETNRISLPILCKIRSTYGLSWKQLGEMIEEEFGE